MLNLRKLQHGFPRPRGRRWLRKPPREITPWLILAMGGVAWWRPEAWISRLGYADPVVSAGLSLAYGSVARSPDQVVEPVRLGIDEGAAVAKLDPRFLSVALDISQVVGGRWWSPEGNVEVGRGAQPVAAFDFERPELLRYARALAPAFLRIGGTEADHVYYDLGGAPSPPELPPGYELRMTAGQFEGLASFAESMSFDLFLTINAGPGPRAGEAAWQGGNAEQLLRFAKSAGAQVAVWELGNEVNGYWFIHGLGQQPSAEQYARDLERFGRTVKHYFPESRVAGPASAFFPVVGEPLAWKFGIMEEFLQHAGPAVDIVTWHYYPQQSRRCPVATRRASPRRLLEPAYLDEVERWASYVGELAREYSPGAEVWLGETGHAQCGGEPEVSDRYVSGLWWLDELGSQARRGQPVVVRQTLVGSDYGLLNRETLEPTPDYYNSLLWKRLMGTRVLAVRTHGENPYLRAYAHCRADGQPGMSVLLLNIHESQWAEVDLGLGSVAGRRFDLSSARLTSRELLLGERPLTPRADGSVALEGEPVVLGAAPLLVGPTRYTFLELDREVEACSAP